MPVGFAHGFQSLFDDVEVLYFHNQRLWVGGSEILVVIKTTFERVMDRRIKKAFQFAGLGTCDQGDAKKFIANC